MAGIDAESPHAPQRKYRAPDSVVFDDRISESVVPHLGQFERQHRAARRNPSCPATRWTEGSLFISPALPAAAPYCAAPPRAAFRSPLPGRGLSPCGRAKVSNQLSRNGGPPPGFPGSNQGTSLELLLTMALSYDRRRQVRPGSFCEGRAPRGSLPPRQFPCDRASGFFLAIRG